MTDSITVSKEDYLKAILEAESEGLNVIPSTLAHWLSVSAPAVTMALKRLKRDGFVDVKSDGIVRLTASGKETAYRTALRHHLIERMLSEVFGMEWYEIHAEAERLEHAVSPAFEARLIEKLGEEGTCPHGNTVLPESPTKRRKRGLIQLSDGQKTPITSSPPSTNAIPNCSSSSTTPASAPTPVSASSPRTTTRPSPSKPPPEPSPSAAPPPNASGSRKSPAGNQ
jgi:Mn-dependent DtxR family transcriptional regulator